MARFSGWRTKEGFFTVHETTALQQSPEMEKMPGGKFVRRADPLLYAAPLLGTLNSYYAASSKSHRI